MRIKLDENIPHRLVDLLAGLGHDVDTLDAEALQGTDDSSVWEASQQADRFLITQDLDFSRMCAGSSLLRGESTCQSSGRVQ